MSTEKRLNTYFVSYRTLSGVIVLNSEVRAYTRMEAIEEIKDEAMFIMSIVCL